MERDKTALVLGASGGIGGEVARRLALTGWRVRALHRRAAEQALHPGLLWLQGDALKADDVARAAEGASVIVHAVNPPGYRHWPRLVLPMIDNSILAARAASARILLPGTVYNFGPDAFPGPGEADPQHPLTRKGRIRVALEDRLRSAADDGSPVLIVRAGDFFGPRPGGNWFSQALVHPGRPVARIVYPGRAGVGHQWAYLPDVAETMMRLLARAERLPRFAIYHMDGHWDLDGRQMIDAIRRAVGDPHIPVRAMPWMAMRLLAPVMPIFRELSEMRYLWTVPLRLRQDCRHLLPEGEAHTPLDLAVLETLVGLGCLPGGAGQTGDSWGNGRGCEPILRKSGPA